MFSLQEYQHVHLLWFKKRSFILVWKPNPPLRSVHCMHLRARADAASESTMGAPASALPLLCLRAASALPLLCLRVRCETGVNQALLKGSRWKHLSSRDKWNLSPATMCCSWQRALYEADALEQRRPCTRTSATTSNFYSHTLKKWSHFGRSLEPWQWNFC